jgi:putative transposase
MPKGRYAVEPMCRLLGVAPSGYYEWLQQPISDRAQEHARLLRLIRASFIARHGIYGAPRVFLDLREAGEACSKHRVARLMREANLRALHGYRTRRWAVGKPSVLIPNLLQRGFTTTRPNKAWVTDITYIRTWQGWLYRAVVMDLFSRMIVGWAAGPTIHRELVLNAVLVAMRRRRPRGTLIHSDQGTQYGSALPANMSETVNPRGFSVDGEPGSEADEHGGQWGRDRGDGEGGATAVHPRLQAEDRPASRRV